jgi:heavy metal translocating P-type ATPase
MRTIKLDVEGMSCGSCAKAVEKTIANLPGVTDAHVDFFTRTAAVTLADDAGLDTQDVVRAVAGAGYTAREHAAPADAASIEAANARRRLQHAGVIALLLFGGWGLGYFGLIPMTAGMIMVLVALAWAAYPIFHGAIITLKDRRLDADVLVAIAVTAASVMGILESLEQGIAHAHSFIAAAEVAFIMLLGEQLEDYTSRRARRALGSLLSLVPPTARVRRGDKEEEIPAEQVRVGNIVVVRAGERIPVDGVVRQGTASVNQAAVTGESVPVDKTTGDDVFIGSLNESGALIVEATRVGDDTTLARIAQLVEAAQQREAPIQRTLDRLAGWMVPVMVTLSILVLVATHDIRKAITVLIVACPCALILATPTAIIAAIARAARAGVLIKGGQHLEAAARLHTIVFDKTGTLTHGTPEVTHVNLFCDHTEAELVQMAAIAEKMSAHPIAHAIKRHAESLGVVAVDPSSFESHHGRGVVAHHNGQRLVVGQRALMDQNAIGMSPALHTHMDKHHDEGHTTLVVAHDGRVCGTICVADTLRDRADEAIARLRTLGVERVVMLTGDNHRVAMNIAGKLGLDDVVAEVMPEQKAKHIESIKGGARGRGVAMVGDGVNDAPALAVADVGIAMGVGGTDVANEAAHIALMADDLSKIAYAVGLSRRALRIIKQGLIFALVYNVVMVTLAATGQLGMIGGAIAHQVSSVVVILNAMRLLRYR